MYTKAVDQNYNKILKYDWLSGGGGGGLFEC